jgi:signal transduction histidine kinase
VPSATGAGRSRRTRSSDSARATSAGPRRLVISLHRSLGPRPGPRPRWRTEVILEDDFRLVPGDDAARRRLEYVQHVNRHRLWALTRRHWFDVLIVVGIGVGLAEATLTQNDNGGPLGPLWFDLLATLGITLPLFARRRFPFGAPVVVGVVFAASSFEDGRFVPHGLITTLVALATFVVMGLIRDRTQAIAGLAFGIGVTAIVAHNDPRGGAGNFVFSSIFFTVGWTIGFALSRKYYEAEEAKERVLRAERERIERAHLAVAEERARIARELHDVVGHSVSVMTVQASAARRLLRPHQEKEREALLVVEQTGREALAEMRRMVGVLRRPEEAPALAPQPSLEHLDKLVAHAREAGLPVDVRIEGEPEPLPAGIDLTAYRLVQEGLTNAIKHARAGRAEVVIRYGGGHVELTVSDDGTGDGDGDRGGHGLVGMRERVSVYGGELEAGPKAGGGFRLRARLPVT